MWDFSLCSNEQNEEKTYPETILGSLEKSETFQDQLVICSFCLWEQRENSQKCPFSHQSSPIGGQIGHPDHERRASFVCGEETICCELLNTHYRRVSPAIAQPPRHMVQRARDDRVSRRWPISTRPAAHDGWWPTNPAPGDSRLRPLMTRS